jgi:hypothetical protein
VTIECRVLSDAWDEPMELAVCDLSPFGMWLECPFPLHLGDEVVAHLYPPGERAIVAHAIVVRSSLAAGVGGMALEFIELSPGGFEILSAFLAGRPPRISRAARLLRAGHLSLVKDECLEVTDEEVEEMAANG